MRLPSLSVPPVTGLVFFVVVFELTLCSFLAGKAGNMLKKAIEKSDIHIEEVNKQLLER